MDYKDKCNCSTKCLAPFLHDSNQELKLGLEFGLQGLLSVVLGNVEKSMNLAIALVLVVYCWNEEHSV